MVNKILNILSVSLFAFVVSYLTSAVFDKNGLLTNTVIHSIVIIVTTAIIVITVILISVIKKYFISRQLSKNK